MSEEGIPVKQSEESPLLYSSAEDVVINKKDEEPSSLLMSIMIVAIVMAGLSGCALPRCAMYAHRGDDDWFKRQTKILIALHLSSLLLVVLTARPVLSKLYKVLHDNANISNSGYEARWDTIKWLLTMLVSLTHLMDVFDGYAWRQAYGDGKEFFLMEAYMFTSGYLGIPEPTEKRQRAVWTSVLAPYASNQIMFYFFQWLAYSYGPVSKLQKSFKDISHKTVNDYNYLWYVPFVPFHIMYYLANLVTARTIAPIWMRLRFPIFSAIFIHIIWLYTDASSYAKIFALDDFFPFFSFYIIGIIARRNSKAISIILDWKATKSAAALSLLTLCLMSIINVNLQKNEQMFGLYTKYEYGSHYWLMGGRDSSMYDNIYPYAIGKAFAWYASFSLYPARIVFVFAIATLFARGGTEHVLLGFGKYKLDITLRGKFSMTNYIMHYYTKLALCTFTTLLLPRHYGILKILFIVILNFIQANIWMTPAISSLLRPVFIAPNLEWLLLPRGSSTTAADRAHANSTGSNLPHSSPRK